MSNKKRKARFKAKAKRSEQVLLFGRVVQAQPWTITARPTHLKRIGELDKFMLKISKPVEFRGED